MISRRTWKEEVRATVEERGIKWVDVSKVALDRTVEDNAPITLHQNLDEVQDSN